MSVAITPFTEAAVRIAESALNIPGGVFSITGVGEDVLTALGSAKRAISDMLGVDITTTLPVATNDDNFSGGTASSQLYGLKLAAFSELAKQLGINGEADQLADVDAVLLGFVPALQVQQDPESGAVQLIQDVAYLGFQQQLTQALAVVSELAAANNLDISPPIAPTINGMSVEGDISVITGTASLAEGESLQVVVNGVVYALQSGLVFDGSAWALTVPRTNAAMVRATAIDGSGNRSGAEKALGFGIVEQDGIIDFFGDVEGEVSVHFDEAGLAVFSRGGLEALHRVAELTSGPKTIAGAVDLLIDITGITTAGDDTVKVKAPWATGLRFIGSGGVGIDEIVVYVVNRTPGLEDLVEVKVDTIGLTNVQVLTFLFEKETEGLLDRLVLGEGSSISNFDFIQVFNGELQPGVGVQLPDNVIIQSGFVPTLAQFKAASSYLSLTDSGRLTFNLANAAEVEELRDFLNDPSASKPRLIGIGDVRIIVGGAPAVALSDYDASLAAAVEQISFPGIIGLTARIKQEILDRGAGDDLNAAEIAAVAAELLTLTQTVTLLQGTVGQNASAMATLIGSPSSPAVGEEGEEGYVAAVPATGVFVQVEALIAALAGRLTSEVSRLEGVIAAVDAENAAEIAAVAAELLTLTQTVTLLQGTVGQNASAMATLIGSPSSPAVGEEGEEGYVAAVPATGVFVQVEALIAALAGRLTSEVSRLEGVIAAVDAENVAEIAAVAAELLTLTQTVTLLQGTVGQNASAMATLIGSPSSPAVGEEGEEGYVAAVPATGVFVQVEALIAALAGRLTSEVSRLEGVIAAVDAENAAEIAAVAAELLTLTQTVTLLQGTVGQNASAMATLIGSPSSPAVGEEGEEGYVAAVPATGVFVQVEALIAALAGKRPNGDVYP
jgi:hypothetical protein